MRLKIGDIFSRLNTGEVVFVTTNSVITNGKKLVMGRGNAKTLVDKYPGIDYRIGNYLISNYDYKTPESFTYGCLMLPSTTKTNRIGLFQTKYNYKNYSDINLIKHSVQMLHELALKEPTVIFNVPYPGIGNGGLKEEFVYELIKNLPNNVHIWKLR